MENIYLFLITFVIIFIILLINHFYKKKNQKLELSKEFTFLKSKYKLTSKDYNKETLSLITVLVNSFIISITTSIITIIKLSYIWQLLIGFTILIILIYSVYGLIGKILIKRKKAKNGKHN